MAFTRDEIIAEAQRRTPPGGNVQDTLLNYARANNIPFEQVDQVLELNPGDTAAYAAQADASNPITQFVNQWKPTDEQQNAINERMASGVGLSDVMNNMGAANTGSMLTNQGTQFSSDQLEEARIFFQEMQRLSAQGVDISSIIAGRANELGLTPNQVASLYTQSMNTDPALAVNQVNQYLASQGQAAMTPYSQQPLTQASPGVVPTLRPQPVQGVDQPGMMSTGFQSPVPSDISSLFGAVQDVRNINQGYLSAPRTDLRTMRSTLEAGLAAQDAAAAEAQKKSLANNPALVQAVQSGDYSQLSPQVAAYLDSLSPAERDQRMYDIDNFLSAAAPFSFARGLMSSTDSVNDSGYPSVTNPGDYGNSNTGEF